MDCAESRREGWPLLFLAAWGILFYMNTGCASSGGAARPPVAKAETRVRRVHGDTFIDDYFWLRNRENPETIEYLEAENAYTEAMTEHTRGLQAKIFEEMKGRIQETDLDVPTPKGEYLYYSRTEEGKQYPIYCRKRNTSGAREEVILDPNKLAKGEKYFRIGRSEVSPDHKLLAYSYDTAGSEVYTLVVKDLETGGLLPDRVPNTYYSLCWGNDNRTLFYTTLDETKRPHRAWRHVLGTPADEDELVYEESDATFNVRLGKTRSERFILMNLDSTITTETRFLDADAPMSEFVVVEPRKRGHEYSVEHHGDSFYIVSNLEAKNFRLMKTPVRSPGLASWQEVIPHRPSVKLDSVEAFANHLVVLEKEGGLQQMQVRPIGSDEPYYVQFPEPVYSFFPTGNEVFDTNTVRFSYTSMVTPRSVFDYDMTTRDRTLLKQTPVLGGYDPANYETYRTFATAKDGTKIPMILVHRKGVTKNAKNPTLLYGYGSYGASMRPSFSSNRVSLLDRGFVYALAMIRGGGEMGRPWYEGGKLFNKRNTFTDFIACAEHLIAEGYTNPNKLAIEGGSAGGLLMGAVVNMRPDLFQAVIAHVPFVDVINTMLDASIPLTTSEYDEWGNPNDENYYRYMLSYSPYDNVEAKDYPNMLIKAGLNDPRVQYWEPAKWTARLRALKTDDNVLILKTNMGAGHGGASGRYDRLKEVAFDHAFLIDMLGVDAG